MEKQKAKLGEPVERIPIEPGETGSEYLGRVIKVARARRAARDPDYDDSSTRGIDPYYEG